MAISRSSKGEGGQPPAPVALPDSSPVWLSRESSILAFNRRILAQSRYADVPVLERLRYVTIVSSNLDEFFEVRFADLLQQSRESGSGLGMEELRAVAAQAHALVDEQYATFNDHVWPDLRSAGIDILTHAERNPAQRQWVAQYFNEQVQPLLMPIGLDPVHPFPQVANKSLNFIVELLEGARARIAIVRVPRALPRVIRLPDQLQPGRQSFVLLSSVIRSHLHELFPGATVGNFSQFRVTRDSDLDVDEEGVTNLRQALRFELSRRHYGLAIRLEVINSCPKTLSNVLQRQFRIPDAALFRVNGPVNLVRLNQLIDQAQGAELRFPRFEPAWPHALAARSQPLMPQIRERDLLLHHPFETFEPVLQLLREAVADPDVLAIKQTIYRTGGQSELMELLLEAARRGKEVLAVVELKARFDEEANIDWADRLEAVGAQVVYGVVGLKTHAKMLLITRREPHNPQRAALRQPHQKGQGSGLRHYLHLSTGNYNAATARLYTDLAFMTCNPSLTQDAQALFRHLSSHLAELPPMKKLCVAPSGLHPHLLRLLDRTAKAARLGVAARVVVKCNALTDAELMNGLVQASQAGVQIDLIIRGACMLAPGVSGLTENIRIRSVVGRFLEHSRVFYFRWGPDEDDEMLWLSSADWMTRNMLRRIELAWPVEDAALRQRVIDEALVPYLHDQRGAWVLDHQGQYQPLDSNGLHAQAELIRRYATWT
ncbi:MAG: polyphosphate kinase 1 [Betaproteobacteria bacterium]|nr:polyphosphate kinase 1 [Betaproteobacteria bacterium]